MRGASVCHKRKIWYPSFSILERRTADAAEHFDSLTRRAKHNQKFEMKGEEFRNGVDPLVGTEFRKEFEGE